MAGSSWREKHGTGRDPLHLSTGNYRLRNCDISLYWQHPFEKNPKLDYVELVNENIQKKMTMRGSD